MDLQQVIECKQSLRQWKEIGYKKVNEILNQLQGQKLSQKVLCESKIADTINTISKKTIEDNDTDGLKMIELAKKILTQFKQIIKTSPDKTQKKPQNQTVEKKGSQIAEEKKTDKPEKPDPHEELLKNLTQKFQQDISDDVKEKIEKFIYQINDMYKKKIQTQYLSKLGTQKTEEIFKKEFKNYAKNFLSKYKIQIMQKVKDNMLDEKTTKDIVDENRQTFMSDKELEIEKKRIKDLEDSENPKFYDQQRKKILMAHEMDLCRKCNQKAVFVEDQKQIRCADEPMTIYYRCANCGNGWKQ